MVLYPVCDAESGTDRGLLRQDDVATLAVSEVISGSGVEVNWSRGRGRGKVMSNVEGMMDVRA